MNGFKQTTLTGYQTVQAHLSTMVETTDMLPVAMSVDSDFFSRIYDVAFGEKGNKDREFETRRNNMIAAQEQEDDQDMLHEVADTALQEIKEHQSERMRSLYGYDFTEDDFKVALRDNLENWDEFSKDMAPDDAEEFMRLSLLAINAEGEDLAQIQAQLAELAPDKMRDTEKKAELNNTRLENKASKLESSSKQDIESADDFLAEGSDSESFDMAFESPNSQITETFTLEVAGTGANAQSMMFSEEGFDIIATEQSVAHQVPDDNTFVLDTLG